MSQTPSKRTRLNTRLSRWATSQMQNARQLAEVFALLTAAAFLISALFDALWMKVTLGLSYFSVATPSDVLMRGVSSIGGAAILALILALYLEGTSYLSRRSRLKEILAHRRNVGSPARAYVKRLKDEKASRHVPAWVIAVVVCLIAYPFMLKSKESGLLYFTGADIPAECSLSPVRWIGSQSAVVACVGVNWIVRDGESVIYVQGKRECDVRRHFWSLTPFCSYVAPDLPQLKSSKASAGSV